MINRGDFLLDNKYFLRKYLPETSIKNNLESVVKRLKIPEQIK